MTCPRRRSRLCCASCHLRLVSAWCAATAASTLRGRRPGGPARRRVRPWPRGGLPANPMGWLITVASRRRIEMWRNEAARRRREKRLAADAEPSGGRRSRAPTSTTRSPLLFLCCHPASPPPRRWRSRCAPSAGSRRPRSPGRFWSPRPPSASASAGRRQRIKAAGAEFRLPPRRTARRLPAVLEPALPGLQRGLHGQLRAESSNRVELSGEAIRLTRQLYARLPARARWRVCSR